MFDERRALESRFDFRSLLSLAQPLTAKKVGSLESEAPGSEQERLGFIWEIEGTEGQLHVGEQYLVRIERRSPTGILDVFLIQAERLLKPISADADPYEYYKEKDLTLDRSGQPFPEALRPVLERAFRTLYVKDNAENKLNFI